MGAKKITSRAIIGMLYAGLEQDTGLDWVADLTNEFESNQESEEYAWLGTAPAMREWIGGRWAKGIRENSFIIKNRVYESTLEILKDWIDRDKTGQIKMLIAQQTERANSHWAKLLAALIETGPSAVCYDNQFFFDTDHVEGESGTQSNSITYDVTTTTAPTAGELEGAVLKGVEQILGIKDDQGEPMNEFRKQFLLYVPTKFLGAAASALGSQVVMEGSAARTNRVITLGSMGGYSFKLVASARSTWTDKFALFATDAPTKPFIRQIEQDIEVDAIAEGSELEFRHRLHQYGISAKRAVGFSYWQRACLVTLN